MPTADYALAFDFIDPADPTVPYRLEFRYPYRADERPQPQAPTPPASSSRSSRAHHPKRGTTVAVSRPGVRFNAIEDAVRREPWPMLPGEKIDLAQIRRRIQAAGLD